ncbi:endonuclease exonuclease phosphatase family domain containing 1 [Nesidiocoris tenuis]|uniref:Endonuclease/exonuclease/phosphatase family domain-containing protein 1 n=1 Tax=Nesidiocoris tenuis TaxID=355587 RepID=A0ABN7B0H0_9HEMI|nr:endonuclease exonuclease phosphatase family domain containing 1 [Nesidiocoris tenuis]
MGQSVSAPPSRKRTVRRRSFRSPFRRTHTLSATFNFLDSQLRVNQLNVNTAAEEELMTLPGVTRLLARNIVEYRNLIGRFNKVEDLALVSGIGADRLDEIRPEICVTRRKVHSCTSSRTQSIDSLHSAEPSPNPDLRPVNVNSSSIFDLMSVRGISQELAAAIIDYRDRRGDFFTLEDLLKVKGMSHVRLSALRPRLSVQSASLADTPIGETSRAVNGKVPASEPLGRRINGEKGLRVNGKAGSSIAAGSSPNAGAQELYDLVTSCCPRPPVDSASLTPLPRTNSFRVASWHLTDMSTPKAKNTAVREVLCLTLLENKISLVALQGVQDAQSLKLLCEEMKLPVCKRIVDFKGSRGNWASQFVPMLSGNGKANLGFMYDAQVFKQILVKVVQDNSMILAAQAVVNFRGTNVDMLNVQMMSDSCHSALNTLAEVIQPSLILGDLSLLGECDKSVLASYDCIVVPSTSTNINNLKDEPPFYDNIYFRKTAMTKYSGISGIVRKGLTHLAIPDGWNWGGPVSQHCPVWAQVNPLPTSASSINIGKDC